MKPEVRKHYFLDSYVVIAPNRLKRPGAQPPPPTRKSLSCIFCPTQQDPEELEIRRHPSRGAWQIRVIANLFPAFSPDNARSFGHQEIVVETPDHHSRFSSLSPERIAKIIEIYAERTETLGRLPHIRYVLVFKNEGPGSGASIDHPHSQIYALPLIPPALIQEQRVEEGSSREGSCLYCQIMRAELGGPRLVFSDQYFVCFAPYASAAPHGLWILPRRHCHNLSELGEAERLSLARLLRSVTGRLDAEGVGYNFFIHSTSDKDAHHLHIELSPRLDTWGGFELGSGIVINPIPPEESPHYYGLPRSETTAAAPPPPPLPQRPHRPPRVSEGG